MKQGDKYLKLVIWILVIMVSSYLLYSVISGLSTGVQTVQAVLYAADEGLSAQGILVRGESIIPVDHSLNMPIVTEGEKVAAGQQVAVSLSSEAAWRTQEQIADKEAELESLRQAQLYQSQLTDSVAVSQKLEEELAWFVSLTAQGKLTALPERSQNVRALVLRQSLGADTQGELEQQIAQLQSELESLRQSATYGTVPVRVASAGYYSHTADGYETVLTPDFILDCTARQWQEAVSSGGRALGDFTAGKLISSATWYCMLELDPQYLEGLLRGDTLLVRLHTEEPLELEMTVWRADQKEGLLVLSSNQRLDQVSALRNVDCDIIFHSYSGLRVPKEAICFDQERQETGVYVLVNQESIWKPVTLLYDVGDAYIAELDQSSTGNLWPEDLILTRTEGLYDGKVVD